MAWYGNCPTLPNTPLIPTTTRYPLNRVSYFEITFSDIVGTFDVSNGMKYVGWCLDPWGDVAHGIEFYFYCSVGSLPPGAGSIPWDMINYLLNTKHVTNFQESMELQYVIWHLVAETKGSVPEWIEEPLYWTDNSKLIYADAKANGDGFVPGPGDIIAVLLVPAEGFSLANNTAQEMFIELTVPPYQNEGCTPGYWKNHLTSWPYPYTPSTRFADVFGVVIPNDSLTLQQALNLGGGGFSKIARHGVAALLSAAHPGVAYPYTVEQVIDAVKDAVGGDKNAIEALVMANELGCPLGGENSTANSVVNNLKRLTKK